MLSDEVIIGSGDDSYFIGGEATYLYTEIIETYNIYSKKFNELRNKFLENPNGKLKDIYFEKRKIYQNKLMELFTLNATTIQELDEELYELCLLDNESFIKVIFHRHQIFEKIMSVCLNQFLNDLKHNKDFKKFFENDIYSQISHNNINISHKQYYVELLKVLHKVINNIIINEQYEVKITDLSKSSETSVSTNEHSSSNQSVSFKTKLINRYCDSCIHNRIFKYCDFIIEKIKLNKDLMHKLENEIIQKGVKLTNLKIKYKHSD